MRILDSVLEFAPTESEPNMLFFGVYLRLEPDDQGDLDDKLFDLLIEAVEKERKAVQLRKSYRKGRGVFNWVGPFGHEKGGSDD